MKYYPPMEQVSTKRCSKCGTEYPRTREYFVLSPSCRDGLAGTCRSCRNAYHRRWKAAHAVDYGARRRQRYASAETRIAPQRIPAIGEKACRRCGVVFPADTEHFVRNIKLRDGLTGVCRGCYMADQRRWRQENREAYLKSKREAYANRYKGKWREQRLWRFNNAPVVARARMLRAGMMERARKMGLPFDHEALTIDFLAQWLYQQERCVCCGLPFAMVPIGDGQKNDRSPSIDRIVPTKGYVIGNVALICWRCNNLKRDATPEELQTVVDWMRTVWGNEAVPFREHNEQQA